MALPSPFSDFFRLPQGSNRPCTSALLSFTIKQRALAQNLLNIARLRKTVCAGARSDLRIKNNKPDFVFPEKTKSGFAVPLFFALFCALSSDTCFNNAYPALLTASSPSCVYSGFPLSRRPLSGEFIRTLRPPHTIRRLSATPCSYYCSASSRLNNIFIQYIITVGICKVFPTNFCSLFFQAANSMYPCALTASRSCAASE